MAAYSVRSHIFSQILKRLGRYFLSRKLPGVALLFFEASGEAATIESALAAWRDNRLDLARIATLSVLSRDPHSPDANNLLGAIMLKEGRGDDAEPYIRKALEVRPNFAAAQNNLGNIHLFRGDLPEAVAEYRRAVLCDPGYVEALINLGGAFTSLGDYLEAEMHCRAAIKLAPEFAGAHSNLGSALLSQGRGGEAVAAFREALRLSPGMPEALINLHLVLEDAGYLVGVVDYFEEKLRQSPESYLPHLRIAQALQAQNLWDEGRDRLLQALAIRPDAMDALLLLGHNYSHAGDARAAISYYRQSMESGPNSSALSGIIFNSLYCSNVSGTEIYQQTVSWADLFIQKHNKAYLVRQQEKKSLRVGYVSRDFGLHSVAYFLRPVLQNHDRNAIFVVCYSTLVKPDTMTEEFRTLADEWRDISLMSIDEAASTIIDDRIDILVDLSGHTSGNRLPLFARRPAPVQITYLGYPATTGLTSIDYRITDPIADPPEDAEKHCSETLWRLPECFLTYQPPQGAPSVTNCPSRKNGDTITFGCFNNASKIDNEVIHAWADILRGTPNSRLLLKSYSFSTSHGRQRIITEFGNYGISTDRIVLMDWSSDSRGHLAMYKDVDVGLDPFPYNGTTTTFEALWMGVPVVTLSGDRHSCRVGATILKHLELDRLVCVNIESYIQCASSLALDFDERQKLRVSMRDRMTNSLLLDHARFTSHLEDAYRAMWSACCSGFAADDITQEYR